VHILHAKITNVKSIQSLSWSIPPHEGAGWHVILGDNGAGKSAFLKAIALALVGSDNAKALRLPWGNWIRKEASESGVALEVQWDEDHDKPQLPSNFITLMVRRLDDSGENADSESSFGVAGVNPLAVPKARGYFSAAYGPFRRFSGGTREYDSLILSYPRLARHLSLFDESVALTEGLDWLRQLRFEELETPSAVGFLDSLKEFVNQEGFLPFGTRLEDISSKEVTFVDGNGYQVRAEDLSDGYRSILSMTFELIRQLAREYGPDKLFSPDDPAKIAVPGVVLIDEVDAHLHPTWQRRIGPWFRQHFPKIQFIVTTHSPLVCQAAEVGTVFRLSAPGSSEEPGMVTGQDLNRLLYGDILDAYGTGIFGQGITRSVKSRERLERLAHLNVKEINEGLSVKEEEEQQNLRATLPTAAHVLNVADAADS
jgi:AAA domain, putative AbiEii toxin, Type IV TA system/AAA domain